MTDRFTRTRLLIGEEAMQKLAHARIAVFGVGGVGGYVCEALVRSGVGAFDIIDNDVVSVTNINRQIIALQSTVGRYKVDVMAERMRDINPDADVRVHKCFVLPDNINELPFEDFDYIVDCIDTVTAKLALIAHAKALNIPIISSMGTGNKLDPTKFRITDISKTRICPLARIMRKELKKRGIDHVKVLYSEEDPLRPQEDVEIDRRVDAGRRDIPGSIAFVPSAAGLIIAGEIIRDLTDLNSK